MSSTPIVREDLFAQAAKRAFGRERGALEMTLEFATGLGILQENERGVSLTAWAARFFGADAPVPLEGLTERLALYGAGVADFPAALRFMRLSDRSLWSARAPASDQEKMFASRPFFNVQAARQSWKYFWQTSALLIRAHLHRTLPAGTRVLDVGCGPGGCSARVTTARMTALRPGQSPPPVRMPIFFTVFVMPAC